MQSDISGSGLAELIAHADEIAQVTKETFGELDAEQINWKPDEDRWSIGQCFDHLIKANESYYPTFEQIVRREKKTTLWERIPAMPGVWGNLLRKALEPGSANKMKAPAIFRPTSSLVDEYIVEGFIAGQERLAGYMKASAGIDVEKIIISSPVTGLITYSLIDAYRIIITHERRHLLQARRVLEIAGFPH